MSIEHPSYDPFASCPIIVCSPTLGGSFRNVEVDPKIIAQFFAEQGFTPAQAQETTLYIRAEEQIAGLYTPLGQTITLFTGYSHSAEIEKRYAEEAASDALKGIPIETLHNDFDRSISKHINGVFRHETAHLRDDIQNSPVVIESYIHLNNTLLHKYAASLLLSAGTMVAGGVIANSLFGSQPLWTLLTGAIAALGGDALVGRGMRDKMEQHSYDHDPKEVEARKFAAETTAQPISLQRKYASPTISND